MAPPARRTPVDSPLVTAILRRIEDAAPPAGAPRVMIGTVSATSPTLRVDVTTDGSALSLSCRRLASYTPTNGESVLIVMWGTTAVVVGAII